MGNVISFVSHMKKGPFVGLVVSIWQGTSKPKLATQPASIKSVRSLRVFQMQIVDDEVPEEFKATAESKVHMLQPWNVMQILDVAQAKERVDSLRVSLSPDSVLWLQQAKLCAKWWPEPEKDSQAKDEARSFGLPGIRKRRKKAKASKQGKSKGKGKKKAHSDGLKETKKTKKPKLDAPAIPTGKPVEFSVANFRKNEVGRKLIKQTICKINDLDVVHFQDNPMFATTGLCRLSFANCQNASFAALLEKSVDYFYMEPPSLLLGSFGMFWYSHGFFANS